MLKEFLPHKEFIEKIDISLMDVAENKKLVNVFNEVIVNSIKTIPDRIKAWSSSCSKMYMNVGDDKKKLESRSNMMS